MPQTLTLPTGTIGYRVIGQTHANLLGRKSISVIILADGKDYGRVKMTGNLELYGNVLCTDRQLGRRTVLNPEDVKLVRRDITMLNEDIIKDPEAAIGKRLKTSLRAGAILYCHLLEEPPLVKRGDLVTILAKSDRLYVTAQGEVKSPGALGELVKVKNLMSRMEIYARVVGPDTVQTDFR